MIKSDLVFEKETTEERRKMKKRDWLISIISGLVLGVFALCFGLVNKIAVLRTVKAESKSDEVISLMLKSHTTWKTMNGLMTTVNFDPNNGSQQTYFNSFEISNPDKARLAITGESNTSILDWFANGSTINNINRENLSYQEVTQQDFAKELTLIPTDIGSIDKEIIYRHPMASIIPSPIGDYIFPTGLAQRQGIYEISGEEVIIGRPTWIVDFSKQNDNNEITMKARYWVDQSTGVILQAHVFSTNPKTFGDLLESASFQNVEFDQSIQESDFYPSLTGLNKEDIDPFSISQK